MTESLDISQFEKRMVIRNMTRDDVDAILEIQRVSFPGMIPWDRAHLYSHLSIFYI